MAEIHGGRRVPVEQELDEIPMENYNPRIQNDRPSVENPRRFDTESCWSFVIRHRLAIIVCALFVIIIIAFIGIIAYLAIISDGGYTQVQINKITELKYPRTEKVTEEDLENKVGARIPIFSVEDESFEDPFHTLIRDTYKILPIASYHTGRMKRVRRETEETSIESCRKRHKNCKIILSRVKKITKNVSQQVNQLQKMINKLGLANEELPSLNNVTALDFAVCLKCESLENQRKDLDQTESIPQKAQNKSQGENTQIYTNFKINNTNSSNSEKPQIIVETIDHSQYPVLPPNITDSKTIVGVTEKNISVVENPDGSKTVHFLRNVTIALTPVSGVPNNSENRTSNSNGEDAVNANDNKEDSFFQHSIVNGNHGSDFDQVVSTKKPEDFQSVPTSSDVTETILNSTTDALAVSTSLGPENDSVSISSPIFVEQNYYPEGKANGETNPFIIPTAETTKGSLQVTYTPNIGWMSYPLCTYGPPNPPPQSVRQRDSESITFPDFSPASSPPRIEQIQKGQSLVSPTSKGQTSSYDLNFLQPFVAGQPFMQPTHQGMQIVPTQFLPTSVPVLPQKYGPTGPGSPYFPVSYQPTATGQAKPIYCAYLPTPTFQFPVVPGISEFQRAVSESQSELNSVDGFGLYDQELKSRDYTAGCPPNTRACSDHRRCIPKSRWCDGEVDCNDASDETRCSCRDRVDRERLCDGYFDCPLGEDELGCFGCDKNSFSCDDLENRRRWGNCVPLVQRCDGYPHCQNGKDELNCNIITQSVEERDMFTVGYTAGYLHRNWRGKWYPACTPSKTWANDACRSEIGYENYRDFAVVETFFLQQPYNGPYAIQTSPTGIEIVNSCSGKAVFVNCPKMPCGTRVPSQQDESLFGVPYSERFPPRGLHEVISDTSSYFESKKVDSKQETDGSNKFLETLSTSMDDKTFKDSNFTDGSDPILNASRVVGGRPSQPQAWPSLVAINRDGNFHCGGVIMDNIWVLTAAHCVDGYERHYYDIQSGILRRFSYSPMEQSRKVSHIVIHPTYDKVIMKNDIALLLLDSPLNFNRWVRPACLPEIDTAGPSWRTGPKIAETCISAGWGSVVEHGPDPDHLREVELPILPNCKYLVDQNEAEICAGTLHGGRDTCQGDSGGPLMCRNPNSPSQWYVAGIVSHGEGCARPNEPGAYTKVSRFVEWINRIRFSQGLPERRPLQRCPGYHCHSGSQVCYPSKKRCDKTVDCMDAEDELNCHKIIDFPLFRSVNPEKEDSLAGKPKNDPSSDKEESNDETASSTIPSTNVNSVITLTEITIIQSTTEETTEKADQYTSTVNPVEISTTVMISTTPESMVPIEQQNSTIKLDKNMTTVIPNRETTTLSPLPPQHFSCRILMQTIDIGKRCDKNVDCEDGTDEENCTCKDYLIKVSPVSICDGHIDCHDGTDEENCEICTDEEFHCKRSRECVPLKKRCDIKGDCLYNEDELGCLTLTNGKYVIIDIDGLPHHNKEGILTSYENGKWVPFCIDRRPNRPATLAKQMCSYFGFVGCESFNETRVHNVPLEARESSATNIIPYEDPFLYSSAPDEEPRCTALYLRCLPTIHTVSLAYRLKAITDGDDTFLWPWHAPVFVDGRYKCSAVLLEPSWLLANVYCTKNVDLNQNYITALLGVSRSYLQVDGPYQQMSQVDEIKTVKNSDAVLLHLKYPTNVTRHVQPMYLQKRTHAPAESDTCATVGVDKEQRTRTIFLTAVIHNCPDNHRCYKNVKQEKCENDTMVPWSGIVFCFGCSGWYPAAVYHENTGPCSFSKKQISSSIDYINTNLITGMQEALNPLTHEPKCMGFRCPLGECINSKKVCDGVRHCRDGADEDTHYCQDIKDYCANNVYGTTGCNCLQSELKCANGQCVPKSTFCDGNFDCQDRSDEPMNCTCAAYMKLTAPEKICDGRRHCFDKSDERPDLCLCKDASFKCDIDGTVCVPEDFVCDGQKDCPSEDDEKYCQSLMSLPSDPPGYGEVIQKSYGVWHSRCFPAAALSGNNSQEDQLCMSLGYSYAMNITESDSNGERNLPPTVPELDKFYIVRLNLRTWIVMRDDKAFVSLHPPSESCYRHYVTCA